MTDPADPLRLNVDIAQDFFFLFAIMDVAGRNDGLFSFFAVRIIRISTCFSRSVSGREWDSTSGR